MSKVHWSSGLVVVTIIIKAIADKIQNIAFVISPLKYENPASPQKTPTAIRSNILYRFICLSFYLYSIGVDISTITCLFAEYFTASS